MKCSQLPWFKDEGWVENHVSISSPDHGAIAQVVIKMEDPCYLPNDYSANTNGIYIVLSTEMNVITPLRNTVVSCVINIAIQAVVLRFMNYDP